MIFNDSRLVHGGKSRIENPVNAEPTEAAEGQTAWPLAVWSNREGPGREAAPRA